MSMSIIINNRMRSAQTHNFGMGDVRSHDMRWHFQAGRVCFTP